MRRYLHSNNIRHLCRNLSSVVTVEHAGSNGVAKIGLNSPPVNSLTKEMFNGILDAFDQVEKSGAKSVVVHASGRVFSAGLDLNVLVKGSESELRGFWSLLQKVLRRIYNSKLPTVAAVNGHAIAGGCIIAMCCDARVINRKAKIGLNEAAFGLVAPPFFGHVMTDLIGAEAANKALSLGTTFAADDAAQLQLVDYVCDDNVLEHAVEMAQFLSAKSDSTAAFPNTAVTRPSRMLQKSSRNLVDDIYFKTEELREKDVQFFLSMVRNPTVQAQVGKYLESLSKKK